MFFLTDTYLDGTKESSISPPPSIFLNKSHKLDDLKINPEPDIIIKTWLAKSLKWMQRRFPESLFPDIILEEKFNPIFKQIEHEWNHWKSDDQSKPLAPVTVLPGEQVETDAERAMEPLNQPIKEEAWSIPLSQTSWADIFHVGDNKMREWVRSTEKNRPYHFDPVSSRKWRLPEYEMPAEYLRNYTKQLEIISMKKAKAKRDKNSK